MIKSLILRSSLFGLLMLSFNALAIELPAQKPLSLTEGVPPNILVTLDDSGSMGRAYTPDSISSNTIRDGKAGRSSAYNASYYDPNTTYKTPKKITYSNNQVKVEDYIYDTDYSFTRAPKDGINPGTKDSDFINLSSSYQFQWGENSFYTGKNCPTTNDCKTAHYFKYTPSAKNSCPDTPTSTSIKKDDCYTYKKITEAERKNFATWFSFYRNRNLATRSAANLAFYTMPTNVRLTWGALNSCNIGENIKDCNNNTIAPFDGQHRTRFFSWLKTFSASGNTPLHNAMNRAGNFLMNNDKAYKDENNNQYACRASYHVLMTDGMWSSTSNGKGKVDSEDQTLPDAKKYTARAPYTDSYSGTLADTAFYYWMTDLRPTMNNDLAPYMPVSSGDKNKDYWDPRNNPATWQHMVNFTVGLGLSNSLVKSTAPTWNGSVDSPTYANMDELMGMGNSGKKWPAMSGDDKAYDLWHAAINSRGEFFSADSPDSLVTAFRKILERINARSTTGSSPAINSSVSDDGVGYSYQASYAADQNWTGNIFAYKYELDATTNSTTRTSAWDAQTANQAAWNNWNARKVYMAGSSANGLKDFTWSNLSTDQKTWLNRDPDKGNNADSLGNKRADFIRGDTSNDGGLFRLRTNILGDFINSKPVTVRGASLLAQYANGIEGANSKYQDFVAAQKSRTPMLYIGGNDGMLHGFNANTGVETFAFIPSAVIENLHILTAKSYGDALHQFYVDGAISVADVYINNAWRTVLVGTLGAGGKGIYALDITDPSDIKLLWEYNGSALTQAKLGYTYASPTIAKLHNNKWAVVVGNGYAGEDSDNGKASLLLLDVQNGSLIKQLVVSGTNNVANGLSTPKVADINGDGVADFAYAGDLQGNLWRFDLAPNNGNASNPFQRSKDASGNPVAGTFSDYKVSFGGTALGRATAGNGSAQAITSAPSIARHPSGLGYIIMVGTGKFYAEGDKVNSVTQSLYGIWDPTTQVAVSTNRDGLPLKNTTVTRANLQQQTILTKTEAANGGSVRELTNNTVDWALPPTPTNSNWTTNSKKVGWYIDFTLSKEMMITDMLQLGRTLYFQTLLPNTDPCNSGVENWAFAINPATGGKTSFVVWYDYRHRTDLGRVYSGIRLDGEGGLSAGYTPSGEYQIHTGLNTVNTEPDPSSFGRKSWRLIEAY